MHNVCFPNVGQMSEYTVLARHLLEHCVPSPGTKTRRLFLDREHASGDYSQPGIETRRLFLDIYSTCRRKRVRDTFLDRRVRLKRV